MSYFLVNVRHYFRGDIEIPVAGSDKGDAKKIVLENLRKANTDNIDSRHTYGIRKIQENSFANKVKEFDSIKSYYNLEGYTV